MYPKLRLVNMKNNAHTNLTLNFINNFSNLLFSIKHLIIVQMKLHDNHLLHLNRPYVIFYFQCFILFYF